MSFESMGLSQPVYKALAQMGFEQPTPIQEQAIPLVLAGKDVIGQAQTGTGKTAAFGLPAIEYCLKKGDAKSGDRAAHPHVLVMAPTRELAVQISVELDRMSQFANVRTICVYGGQEIEKQFRAFERKVDIVVGTPGRILDHIERQSLDLSGVDFVVLDEADRMLDMGFIEDIVSILDKCRPQRQTMLFSATLRKDIENIAYDYMREPEVIRVSEDKITIDKVVQKFMLVDARERLAYLFAVLQFEKPTLAVVFVRTKASADKLARILRDRGFEADCLHGDMRQGARDRAIRKLREGHLHVLVATDLASRGLDVFNITHVINYDLPEEYETYVHRIGRTARMGAEGVAISFAFEDQEDWLRGLVNFTRVPLEELKLEPVKFPPRVERRSEGGSFESRGGSGRGEGHGHGGHREGGYSRGGRSGGYGERRSPRSEGGHSRGGEGGGYSGRSSGRGHSHAGGSYSRGGHISGGARRARGRDSGYTGRRR
ncbi:MAG: DEAD/DEAH box helicase [Candidatus Micrarchaeota archaeon]